MYTPLEKYSSNRVWPPFQATSTKEYDTHHARFTAYLPTGHSNQSVARAYRFIFISAFVWYHHVCKSYTAASGAWTPYAQAVPKQWKLNDPTGLLHDHMFMELSRPQPLTSHEATMARHSTWLVGRHLACSIRRRSRLVRWTRSHSTSLWICPLYFVGQTKASKRSGEKHLALVQLS